MRVGSNLIGLVSLFKKWKFGHRHTEREDRELEWCIYKSRNAKDC